MAIRKRFQQGIRALLAFTQTVDYNLAEQYLSPEQMTLFRQMSQSEKLHSIQVLRTVLAQESETPNDLAVAALMHDVGKSRYHLAVWQKTISILVMKLLPQLDQSLSATDHLTFWRAPFVVRRHHPKWSAELLASVKSSSRVVWLAAHHADAREQWHGHPDYGLLDRLIRADDAN